VKVEKGKGEKKKIKCLKTARRSPSVPAKTIKQKKGLHLILPLCKGEGEKTYRNRDARRGGKKKKKKAAIRFIRAKSIN